MAGKTSSLYLCLAQSLKSEKSCLANPVEVGEETSDYDRACPQVETQPLDLRVDQCLVVVKRPPLDMSNQHAILLDPANSREKLVSEADDP